MKIEFWVIGKHRDAFIEQGTQFYLKKIKYFADVKELVFQDIKQVHEETQLKNKEAEKYLEKIKDDDFIILLDEKGQEYNSRQFAHFIEQKQIQSTKKIIFITGGAFGFGEKLQKRANHQIALSRFTFSHQLVRIVFLEQLYRAFSINHHFPYHND